MSNLLLACFFVVANAGFSATNVLPTGLPLALLTSKEHAKKGIFSTTSVNGNIDDRASLLCKRLGKTLDHIKYHEILTDELENMIKERLYFARVVAPTADEEQSGLLFHEGQFVLYEYKKEPSFLTLESGLFMSSAVIAAGGAIAAFMIYTGFEGVANPPAALITGVVSTGVSAALAVGGGVARVYRNYFSSAAYTELNAAEKETPFFAMPTLIDELWCE